MRPWVSKKDVPLTVLEPDSLQQLRERHVLALAGHEALLPQAPPFEPSCRDPLYLYSFHELGWLRAALASNALQARQREQLGPWLRRYLAHLPPWSSVYWDPYPIAGRILSLDAMARRGNIPVAMARTRMVEWTLMLGGLSETHLQGNHLLRNRAAFAVGSTWLDGSARMVQRLAIAKLDRECQRQFLADGCHEERTPGYHVQCLLDVLHVIASSGLEDGPHVRSLRQVAAKATVALDVMEHRDGLLAAFGDTAPASCPRPTEVRGWARDLGIAATQPACSRRGSWSLQRLPFAGFAALRGEGIDVYVKDGAFGAPHQPGHAHCDLFGLEIDLRRRRIVVDPGVHAYHDPDWRLRTRASASHCTPALPEREQAEIWSRFRCGWRPRLHSAAWRTMKAGFVFEGEAEAFGPKQPLRVHRQFQVQGRAVRIEDRIPGASTFGVCLPLAPDIDVNVHGNHAQLNHAGRPVGSLYVERGRLSKSSSHVSHRFGARQPAATLRIDSLAEGGSAIVWRIEAES